MKWLQIDLLGKVWISKELVNDFARVMVPNLVVLLHPSREIGDIRNITSIFNNEVLPFDVAQWHLVNCVIQMTVITEW